MNVLYPAIFEYDRSDKRYTVHFPDLSEAITEGTTLEEAAFNAAEVLTLTLEGRIDDGLEIPPPSHYKNAKLIAPSAKAQTALLIRWAKGNHTIAEIAHALNSPFPTIAKLENPHTWPSMHLLERAAAIIGKRLVISLEPAFAQIK